MHRRLYCELGGQLGRLQTYDLLLRATMRKSGRRERSVEWLGVDLCAGVGPLQCISDGGKCAGFLLHRIPPA